MVNQYTFVENGNNRRPDIILFINGFPLVLIELKSPSKDEVGAENAYNQIRNYMKDIPSMFYYNAICVISDLSSNKAGTITSGLDRFMEWKTKDGDYENTAYAQFDTFYEGMFQKERLLDILKNFILFSGDGQKQFKILAGYHQYFAVRKAIEKAKIATKTDGKGGVFWHTQGSGKSLSMVFYAHLLQEALDSPTIVVMTDRIDLDDQLYTQFAKYAKELKQETDKKKTGNTLLGTLQDYFRCAGKFGVVTIIVSCLYYIPSTYIIPARIMRIGSAIAYGVFSCNILFLWLVFIFLVNSLEKSV